MYYFKSQLMMLLTRCFTALLATVRYKMADASKNLSFNNPGNNQQKIIINSSQTVTLPHTLTALNVVSVPTGLTEVPAYRAFIETAGTMRSLSQQFVTTADSIVSGIDANFNFFIRVLNIGSAVPNVTFYYRIYIDSKPS